MRSVVFSYRNHRGEVEIRNVIPDSIEFITNPGFNYQPGWFLSGEDLDRKARRSFALSHIVMDDEEETVSGRKVKASLTLLLHD